jgi:hypothetical protein
VYKHVLFQQINLFNPDIIIFGGTIHHFIEDLSIPITALRDYEYFIEGKKLYIKNYHPNQRINSCDVDPPFLHVDPLGKRAINVRA